MSKFSVVKRYVVYYNWDCCYLDIISLSKPSNYIDLGPDAGKCKRPALGFRSCTWQSTSFSYGQHIDFSNNAALNSSSYSLNNQLSNCSGHYSTPSHHACAPVCVHARVAIVYILTSTVHMAPLYAAIVHTGNHSTSMGCGKVILTWLLSAE